MRCHFSDYDSLPQSVPLYSPAMPSFASISFLSEKNIGVENLSINHFQDLNPVISMIDKDPVTLTFPVPKNPGIFVVTGVLREHDMDIFKEVYSLLPCFLLLTSRALITSRSCRLNRRSLSPLSTRRHSILAWAIRSERSMHGSEYNPDSLCRKEGYSSHRITRRNSRLTSSGLRMKDLRVIQSCRERLPFSQGSMTIRRQRPSFLGTLSKKTRSSEWAYSPFTLTY